MSDLIERLRAATMGFDWRDLPDEASIPAVPLLREAADHIASLEAERDEARRQRDDLGRAWDSADARAKEAEAERDDLRAALAPFGNEACSWSDMWEDSFVPIFDTGHLCEHCGHANSDDMKAKFTVGDLRRAARALSGKGDGE